jgi:type VI secretion system protein ImpB
MDNFENRMAAIQPGISMRVRNKLGDATDEKMQVNLRFNKMDDFKPAEVARQVPALAKLLEAREQLQEPQLYMDGKADAEKKLRELLKDPR